jgi:hypothetical protein
MNWYWDIEKNVFHGGFVVFVMFDERVKSTQIRARHNQFLEFSEHPRLAFVPFTAGFALDASA